MSFRLTQGTFSYLPDMTDEQIEKQVQYAINQGWAIMIEFTDDPHPRNVYWEMWGHPMFDVKDAKAVMLELNECRKVYPHMYIRLSAYDSSYGRQTTALQFIVQRPAHEPGFHLERQEVSDRQIRYTLRSYATDKPKGERYTS